MLSVYVCDDDEVFLDILKKYISRIAFEELSNDAKIVCATQKPEEILEETEKNKSQALYFLDVDLGPGEMSGIELGANIRIKNPGAYIVMITAHADKAFLTYEYKVGAKGYILKDQVKMLEFNIKEHIINAYEILSKNKIEEQRIVAYRNNGNVHTIYANQIYYIEVIATTQRKLRICEKHSFFEATGVLYEIKKQLDESFYQCHKSYIINTNHVKHINSKYHTVLLNNGKEIPVSFRNYRAFQKYYMEFIRNRESKES